MKIFQQHFHKLSICIFLLLGSCSNDDEAVKPNPNNPPAPPGSPAVDLQTCLITSIDSPSLSYTITRNELGLPTKINFTEYKGQDINYSCTLKYDESQRLIKLENETVSLTYGYDENNRVISEKLQPQPNPQPPYLTNVEKIFTYNDQGYMDSAYYSAGNYQRFEYSADGNVLKSFAKYPGQAEFLTQEFLEFDDKKNPYYEFPFFHNILLDRAGVTAIVTTLNPVRHKANVMQSKSFVEDGTFTIHNNSYEYNEFGYPVLVANTYTYGYDCE